MTPIFISLVILYALSDVITGVFGLNGVPENQYILYNLITNVVPYLTVFLVLVVFLIWFIDRKQSQRS